MRSRCLRLRVERPSSKNPNAAIDQNQIQKGINQFPRSQMFALRSEATVPTLAGGKIQIDRAHRITPAEKFEMIPTKTKSLYSREGDQQAEHECEGRKAQN